MRLITDSIKSRCIAGENFCIPCSISCQQLQRQFLKQNNYLSFS